MNKEVARRIRFSHRLEVELQADPVDAGLDRPEGQAAAGGSDQARAGVIAARPDGDVDGVHGEDARDREVNRDVGFQLRLPAEGEAGLARPAEQRREVELLRLVAEDRLEEAVALAQVEDEGG